MIKTRVAVLGLGVLVATAAVPLDAAGPKSAKAAHGSDVAGDWFDRPQIDAGGLAIGLHLRRNGGVLTGTVDVPQMGGVGAPLANIKGDNLQLSFDVAGASAHYAGTWDPAQKGYVGTLTSPGGNGPFTFVRGTLPPPKPVDWSAPMAPGFAYAPAAAAPARVGPTLPVGKCVNLSDTLEAPVEGAWGGVFQDDDSRSLRPRASAPSASRCAGRRMPPGPRPTASIRPS